VARSIESVCQDLVRGAPYLLSVSGSYKLQEMRFFVLDRAFGEGQIARNGEA